MNSKRYDEICNHCGKEIHPPRDWQDGIKADDAAFLASPDCVYAQRFYASPHPQHGKTNYVCLECDAKIDSFLQEAGVS